MKVKNPIFTLPITGQWQILFADIKNRRDRSHIRRLFGYCSSQNIAPDDLNDQVLTQFSGAVKLAGVSRSTQATRDAIKAWNKLCSIHGHWPRITLNLQDRRRPRSLSQDNLPQSFQISLEAFILRELRCFDPQRRAVRSETTRKDKRQKIYQLATHAVQSGIPLDSLLTIEDLARKDVTISILERLWMLSSEKPKNHFYNLARQLRYIAESIKGPNHDVIDLVKRAEQRLREKNKGLSLKTRNMLRPFRDGIILRRLMNLPFMILERVKQRPPNLTDAIALPSALMIDLFFSAPVPIHLMAAVDYEINIMQSGDPRRSINFTLAGERPTKLRKFLLSDETLDLLDLYISDYMPLFEKRNDMRLFVSRYGANKSPSGLSAQIKDFIWREIGQRITPSVFRHLAAFIFKKQSW